MSDQQQNGAALEGTSPRVATMMLSVMAGIAAFCGLLIVTTFELTRPIIRQNQAEYLERSIFEVLPGARSVRKFVLVDGEQLVPLEGPESSDQLLVYATYDANGDFAGVALQAAGQGYQDTIRILYGYVPDAEEIVGMKVLETKETPGLGDKIELDPVFRANFEHLDARLNAAGDGLANAIVTVKSGAGQHPWEIDGITGATISSKAIGKMLNESAGAQVPLVARNLARLRRKGDDS